MVSEEKKMDYVTKMAVNAVGNMARVAVYRMVENFIVLDTVKLKAPE